MRTTAFAITLCGFVVMAGPAQATMPMLTPCPQNADFKACQQWATQQDEDAVYMWGTQESGKSNKDVALSRLTLSCMGDEHPEIVGFYSEVGEADRYCHKHKTATICQHRS